MDIRSFAQVVRLHILLLGMSTAGEQEETVEFYKIRLMEKDREIADFTAKMKKVEFKHNRELKETTIGRERAEALLKEEKGRCDKQTKAAHQHAQQNQVLQLRLQEMRRDKEREVADITAKYNTLKEEVRSYERILPTFTFLNELALTIAQLPNYEDLFLTSRQKTAECERLLAVQRQAEEDWEEAARGLRANEELLRGKRSEAERNLKEVVAKLVQQEHQMSDLRLHNQQLIDNCLGLEEELQLTRERCQSLEDSVRDYESKIERLAEDFEVEMAGREEQLVREQRGEMVQLEEEMRGQEAQLQRREAMFSEQVRILEEEIAFLNGKYQAEVDTFEEHYLTLKEETERMRAEILAEKRRYDELQECYSGSIANLAKATTLYEQAQERNRALEQRIASYQQRLAQQSKANEQQEQEKLDDMQRQYDELWEKLERVGEHCGKVEEERDQLQEENYLLREELSNTQLHHNESKSFFLELPKPDERMRKKSSEIDSPNPIIQGIRERRNSTQMNELEKKNEVEVQRRIQSQNKAVLLQGENSKIKSELEQLRKQKDKLLSDSIALKEKIIALTRANIDHEKIVYGHSTKNKLDRTKMESLDEELRHLSEENKREKQANKKLREQAKTAKETHAMELDRLTKQVKQSLTQLEVVKTEKEKLRIELLSKEKIYSHEAALLKSSRELEEILKEQIRQLKQQKQALEADFLQLQNTLLKTNDESILLRKEAERLEECLKQAQRETQMTNESLERERKERSLLTVPSLQSIGEDAQEDTFNQIYATIPQKEGEINLLQRSILDLKEELETVKLTQQARTEAMEAENSHYVQTIIEMKMRCAQSEMRASQKEYLYMQLKKRAAALNIPIK